MIYYFLTMTPLPTVVFNISYWIHEPMDFRNYVTWKEHFEDALSVYERLNYIKADAKIQAKLNEDGMSNDDFLFELEIIV